MRRPKVDWRSLRLFAKEYAMALLRFAPFAMVGSAVTIQHDNWRWALSFLCWNTGMVACYYAGKHSVWKLVFTEQDRLLRDLFKGLQEGADLAAALFRGDAEEDDDADRVQ